jgi:L-fucose isomerase-like protein
MVKPKVGFVVYGVHKDGLQDPMGQPFIDDAVVAHARAALENAGVELVVEDMVIASREEARACFSRFKKIDDLDTLILFSGTWVWAAHLVPALREFAMSGKGVLLWTNPGSQGWRPVGGLVMHAGLKEVGIHHRFVYGAYDEPETMARIMAYCRAGHLKNDLNMSIVGVFGGRGMGQTCGVADPSQWLRVFGIDIDSRDTTRLLETAKQITADELLRARREVQPLFSEPIPEGPIADRSLRMYVAIDREIAREGWSAYTIQSFPGLGDDYSATCFAQSLMLDRRVATSTLSDFNTLMTVKLLGDMGDEPVYYGDFQHIDKARKEFKIIGDGACPPSLAGTLGPAKISEHGIPTEGEAGGISVDLVCKPGEGVVAHLGRTNGEFEMVFTRCTVFEPAAAELEQRRLECGIPRWPHAFITAHCDVDKLIKAWNSEYAVLGYGAHLYEDLMAFCELTGIKAQAL